MKYRPHEFADLAGVTVKTLQRWDDAGKLKANRTVGNHRYYTDQHLNLLRGLKMAKRKHIIYCRVSSHGQKPELKNQAEAMQNFATAKGVEIDEVIQEVGGGMNFKRKKFIKLITQILLGQVDTVYVAHKDRLCRFAFELVEHLAQQNQTQLVVANNDTMSPQQEMVEDLMAIIHCFSCRLYGLRNYAKTLRQNIDKNLDTELDSKCPDIQC